MFAPQKKNGWNSAITFLAIAVFLALGFLLTKHLGSGASSPEVATTPETDPASSVQTVPSSGAAPIGVAAPNAPAVPGLPPAAPSLADANSPSPAPTQPSGPPTPEMLAQFSRVRTETLSLIPTQSQLRRLDHEETHFTPKQLLVASMKIGELAQMIEDHPELAEEGLRFYKQCAEMPRYPNAVRASCFVDFQKLNTQHPSSIPAPEITEQVRALAAKIMS